MRATYYYDEDALVLLLPDKPIVREASQYWNTHISYATDGTIVEMVFLEAFAQGVRPVEVLHGVISRWRKRLIKSLSYKSIFVMKCKFFTS